MVDAVQDDALIHFVQALARCAILLLQKGVVMRTILRAVTVVATLFSAASAVTLGPGEVDLTAYPNILWHDGGMTATTPFGMVQFGPFTENPSMSGFRANGRVRGFSVNRLAGVGCHILNNFPIMPVTVPVGTSPSTDPGTYASAYTSISGSPGTLNVQLASGVVADLTASQRCGLGRFTFPVGQSGTVLIHAGLQNSPSTDACETATVDIGTDNVIRGSATGNRFCDQRNAASTIYLAARFDRSFSAFGTYTSSGVSAGSRSASGPRSGAYLTFDTQSNRTVVVKFALSYVSSDNALANLDAEVPSWNFDATHDSAANSWNHLLNQIRITANGTDSLLQKRLFYTNLYRSLLHPSLSSDVNGQYRGFDDQPHTLSSGHRMYTMFSGWDVYRSQMQLAALMAPGVMSDICQSFVPQAQERNGGYPRWTVANRESGIMSGNPAVPSIASAYAFGVRGFDADTALGRMPINGDQGRLHEWRRYIPSPDLTLEYCIVDFSISRMAAMLGQSSLAQRYLTRSDYWRSIYRPENRLVCGRPSSPCGAWSSQTDGWLEGTAQVYFWMVPHNLGSLCDTLGGNASATARLDTFFTTIATGYDYGATTYNAGNEPDIHAPWVYNWAGSPYRCQYQLRRVIDLCFKAGGVPGDDDLGTMSAWYVFASLGIFPMIPGVAGFTLNTPVFEQAVIKWPARGATTTINGGSSSNTYIQSVTLNGRTLNTPWVWFDSIADGGTLQYTTGSSPNASWGSSPAARPPSFNSVSQDWSPNLAEGAGATSFDQCGANESAANAVDCNGGSKWCGRQWLALDLGSVKAINKWVVLHAEAGGENPTWNTRDFRLQRSSDGTTWVDVDTVRGNTAGMSFVVCPTFSSRYVRLYIDNAGADNTARIYEFELHNSAETPVALSPGGADRRLQSGALRAGLVITSDAVACVATTPMPAHVTVCDARGRAVQVANVGLRVGRNRLFSMTGHAPGLYLLVVRTPGERLVQRVIVER
jgi:predicted alpha-1,2-mannosidase